MGSNGSKGGGRRGRDGNRVDTDGDGDSDSDGDGVNDNGSRGGDHPTDPNAEGDRNPADPNAVPGGGTEMNDAPTLPVIADKVIEEGSRLAVSLLGADPDGDSLTYEVVDGPPGAYVNSFMQFFAWTPTEEQGPKVYFATVKVTDSGTPPLSDMKTFQITVTEQNRPPKMPWIWSKSVFVNQPLSFTFKAEDPDHPLNQLTYSFPFIFGDGTARLSGNLFLEHFRWNEAVGIESLPATK